MFGRNVASYKFALAQSLLDIKAAPGDLVTLEDLAKPFSSHICRHLKSADKQGTSAQSRFLDACRAANAGEIEQDELAETTVRLGFNNVIDAFHVVGGDDVPHRFFLDERKQSSGLKVCDAFGFLTESDQSILLPEEVEARWRLVESAWETKISRGLLTVGHDAADSSLFMVDREKRRRPVTGAREALSGYQKGHCFYCFDSLGGDATAPEVDHFFPHRLISTPIGARVDQVWNLVLACSKCNRGTGGKFDRLPSTRLLSRLHTRNEYLISSHHPLRETLLSQTGNSEPDRESFLQSMHDAATEHLVHNDWEAVEQLAPLF